ncbi:sulfite exporter TauE/SafE family protein [Planctomonas psychrotolerans]|uniref:sulfite exporter TauE/SafE family protein n=1 Tax=Planctomonas psychrotolerans TaxID=2528712 RepID=UPI00123849A7|nr:sulfite exporter TauE/SafE family protein [Planctomonas psychrotolerans]
MFGFVLASVLLGAITQRVTGMGFALIVAPLLVVLLGPFDGVMIVNLCGAVSSGLILSRVWRSVDWWRFRWLAVSAMVGIVPGGILAAVLPDAALEIGIGVLLLLALSTSLLLSRASVVADGRGLLAALGASSGFMNAAAGIGGPAVSIYAVISRWPQAAFAATLQPYFFTIASLSLLTKLLVAPGSWPELEAWMWLSIIAALFAGITVGELVAKRVSARRARGAVLVIAFAGAVAAIVNGTLGLTG